MGMSSGYMWHFTDVSLLLLRCGVLPHPIRCTALHPRREYNRRVREVVEQSWIEQDT